MNVVMQEDATKVDDVVVMGYGVSNQLAGAAPGVGIRGTAASGQKGGGSRFCRLRRRERRDGGGADAEPAGLRVRNQTALHHPFRRQERRSRNREVRPAGRLYLPEHAEDRQGRLPRGGRPPPGGLHPAEGRGQHLFREHVRGQEHPRSRSDERHTRFSMGRDRSIRIERTKENDYSSRRAIGSNQTQTVAWKFSVRNTRPEPVVLTLADQLPVSRNSAIAVSAEELSGRPAGQGERHRHLETGAETRRAARTAPALRREISQRPQPDNRVTRRGEGNEKREDCIELHPKKLDITFGVFYEVQL